MNDLSHSHAAMHPHCIFYCVYFSDRAIEAYTSWPRVTASKSPQHYQDSSLGRDRLSSDTFGTHPGLFSPLRGQVPSRSFEAHVMTDQLKNLSTSPCDYSLSISSKACLLVA